MKSCGVLQLARRHVCFAPFVVGCVSVSGDFVPVMRFISRCGNGKFSDVGHDLQWHNEAHQLVKGVCFCGV